MIRDIVAAVSTVLVFAGFWMIYPPLSLILMGVAGWLAVIATRGADS